MIADVTFEAPTSSHAWAPKSCTALDLVSVVHTAAIPLYLTSGPSSRLHLAGPSSEEHLQDAILGGCQENFGGPRRDLEISANGQSQHALLLRAAKETHEGSFKAVTEILIYATKKDAAAFLPSPPRSSSPSITSTSLDAVPVRCQSSGLGYCFYALPLCSNVFQHVRQASGLITPPPENPGSFFLPESLSEIEAAMRRNKISSVFDAASRKRRKSKANGGEGVSKAMANLERSNSQHHMASVASNGNDSAQDQAGKTSLIRSSSDSQVAVERDKSHTSRPTELGGRKRSSLHRVESANVGKASDSASGLTSNILEQNKTALSKIVMAGMRLHGLQQRKKPQKLDTNPFEAQNLLQPDLADNPRGDDEYKQIYHQTLKSALFTCRAQCVQQLIPQECMRDVVDKLLTIFCNDPLQAESSGITQTPGFSINGRERDNPFDLPSSSAAKADINVWNTPVSRKRKRPDSLPPD